MSGKIELKRYITVNPLCCVNSEEIRVHRSKNPQSTEFSPKICSRADEDVSFGLGERFRTKVVLSPR